MHATYIVITSCSPENDSNRESVYMHSTKTAHSEYFQSVVVWTHRCGGHMHRRPTVFLETLADSSFLTVSKTHRILLISEIYILTGRGTHETKEHILYSKWWEELERMWKTV